MSMKKIVFKVVGMDCTSCAFNIDGILEDLDGVKESQTNYAKQLTEVTFDSEKITSVKILKVVKAIDNNYTIEIQK